MISCCPRRASQLEVFAATITLPKSKFGEAVAYATPQLPLIQNYLRVGFAQKPR